MELLLCGSNPSLPPEAPSWRTTETVPGQSRDKLGPPGKQSIAPTSRGKTSSDNPGLWIVAFLGQPAVNYFCDRDVTKSRAQQRHSLFPERKRRMCQSTSTSPISVQRSLPVSGHS